jgi:alkanesulfonate monooxygenase SsuD/methylene tetrahydromethanopterin reductase-like flavin-dependent oxidoreductase (luciferase family)
MAVLFCPAWEDGNNTRGLMHCKPLRALGWSTSAHRVSQGEKRYTSPRTAFCVGTAADCIRFLERYEALGIEEVFLLCAIGPAQHQEVLHTMRLFGEQVIPHFQAKEQRTAVAQAST